jgi:hypothetical protein
LTAGDIILACSAGRGITAILQISMNKDAVEDGHMDEELEQAES